MLDGVWRSEDQFPTDEQGAFVRKQTSFHEQIRADGSSDFEPAAGRYHLYVSYACPWAHRVLISRALYGLEQAISVAVSHPLMLEHGWVMRAGEAEVPDEVLGVDYLWQVYAKARPDYSGRVTVPTLWDRERHTIVNNESRELIRMISTEFADVATKDAKLCPTPLREAIDETITTNYQPINNGVYRCGFARSQAAYDDAVRTLFSALDRCEALLAKQRFLCGDTLTEADICLFTTLFRFDMVYVAHFKCNLRRIVDYPNLWGFVRDVYQTPGVAPTCNVRHIKQHYFGSHESVNPSRIVAAGPEIDFSTPHGRG